MNSSIDGLQCIIGKISNINVYNPPVFLSFTIFLHSPIWNLANYILRSFQLWPHIHLCFQDLLFPKCKPFHNLMVEPKLKAISNKHSCKQWFSICCCGKFLVEINKHPCCIMRSGEHWPSKGAQNELQGLFQNLQKVNVE